MIPEIQQEIDAAIETARWQRAKEPAELPVPPGTELYKGEALSWLLVVAAFNIEDQGFPPGSMGYDGVARREGLVVRLTRDQARSAYARAVTDPLRGE